MTGPLSRLSVPGANDEDPPLGYLRLGAYDSDVESGYLPANWADGTGAPVAASPDGSAGVMMTTSGAVVVKGAATAMSFGNGLSIAVSGGAVRFMSADGTFRLAATGIRLSADKPIDTAAATDGHLTVRADKCRFESGTTLKIDGDDLDQRCDHYRVIVQGKKSVTVKAVSTSFYLGVAGSAYKVSQISTAPVVASTGAFALNVAGVAADVKDRDILNTATKSSDEGLKSMLANMTLVTFLAQVRNSAVMRRLGATASERVALLLDRRGASTHDYGAANDMAVEMIEM